MFPGRELIFEPCKLLLTYPRCWPAE